MYNLNLLNSAQRDLERLDTKAGWRIIKRLTLERHVHSMVAARVLFLYAITLPIPSPALKGGAKRAKDA